MKYLFNAKRMRKSALIFTALVAAMCLVSGCSESKNDNNAWIDGEFNHNNFDDRHDSPQNLAADSMIASVDGNEYEFKLQSAKLSHGDMAVVYVCYTPRGDELYKIKLYFDKNIAPGKYSSDNKDRNFRVNCGFLDAKTPLVNNYGQTVTEGVGSFSLDLTYRDANWETYEGTFSAHLGRSQLSGTHGESSMIIDGARFNFTLQ